MPPTIAASASWPLLVVPGVAAALQLSGAGPRRVVVEPPPKPQAPVRVERVRPPCSVVAYVRPRHRHVSFRSLAERRLPSQSPGHNVVPNPDWVGSFLSSRELPGDQDR